jgi:hypothetical protein
MKAKDLKPGGVFRVTPRDPESPLRVCRTNNFRDGIKWGWPAPANTLYWCWIGADCDVEPVQS